MHFCLLKNGKMRDWGENDVVIIQDDEESSEDE